VLLRVHPQTRLGHTTEPGDSTLTGGPVLESHHQVLADAGVFDTPALDVALLLEDLGDVRLNLRIRHRYGLVVCRVRVTQTCEHVCDWVGHRHGRLALSSLRFPRKRNSPPSPRPDLFGLSEDLPRGHGHRAGGCSA